MTELQELLKRYVAAYKGDPGLAAGRLKISTATLKRWLKGSSEPHAAIKGVVTEFLKRELR